MTAHDIPKAVFISERTDDPRNETPCVSYRLGKDLLHVGQHPINPLIRNNGVIEYERGAACVGITPHEELVLLSTTDRDDMELEHRFGWKSDGTVTSRSAVEIEALFSPDKLVVGQDILKDGSVYLGRFIKQKPYGSDGDTNYNHMLGVAAWKSTPKNLLHSILDRFSQHHRQDLLDSGILIHHDPLIWTSKEMVFAARPVTSRNFYNEEVHVTNNKGEKLYNLHTLTSPRKGWNSARMFHEVFTATDQKNLSRLKRPLMHVLFNCIAVKRKNVTMPDIKAQIDQTFSPTVKKLRQGACPYALESGYGEPVKGVRWIKGRLKQAFATVAFAVHDISNKDLLIVAAPSVIGFSISSLTEKKGWAALAVAPLAYFAVRFGLLLFSRSKPVFENASFSDLIHHFWKDDVSKKNIPQQFDMVRPDAVKSLRILSRHEIDLRMRTSSNAPVNTPLHILHYMIGTLFGPFGSQASVHKIGNQWVVKSDEELKSSGMQIEYWPLLNVAFAKNPASDHLPQSLTDSFAKSGKPICMVYANRDPDTNALDYGMEFITQEEYDQIVELLGHRPARDLYRQPEVTGEFLKDYPLGPVAEGQDPYETSEWAKRAGQIGAVEILGEVADAFKDILEGLSKGPH